MKKKTIEEKNEPTKKPDLSHLRYVGDFVDGRKHGEGTLTWPDGRSYCGQWQDGKQHGTAVAHCRAQTAKGLKRQSIWKDGDLGGENLAASFPGMCFFVCFCLKFHVFVWGEDVICSWSLVF